MQDTLVLGLVVLQELEEAWRRRRCGPGCSASPTTAPSTCYAAGRCAWPNQRRRLDAGPANPDPVEMLMRQEAVKTAVSRFAELSPCSGASSSPDARRVTDRDRRSPRPYGRRGEGPSGGGARVRDQCASRPASGCAADIRCGGALASRSSTSGSGRAAGAARRRRELIQSRTAPRRYCGGYAFFSIMQERRARPSLVLRAAGDRGVRNRADQAQLHDTRVARRPDRLHPRLRYVRRRH